MWPVSRFDALPADLRQQLLAMPLDADDRNDVASALLSLPFAALPLPPVPTPQSKSAPRPERQRGA